MTAALARIAPAGARCAHVFADRVVDTAAARSGAHIDAGFLAEAGWDPVTLLLAPPAEHPLLGRKVCRAAGCQTTATAGHRVCAGCQARLARRGWPLTDIDRLPARPGAPEPTTGHPQCLVAACLRPRRHHGGVYCEAHQQRWNTALSRDPGLDERHWRRISAPVSIGGQVSFVGLTPLVVAQLLLGLQQRCRLTGVKTKDADLRLWCNDLRAEHATDLTEHHSRRRAGTFTSMVNAITTHAVRTMATPETEADKDVWDLAVFGHDGSLDFTPISQPWLRQVTKRWAADELPRRRVRPHRRTNSGSYMRHHLGCVARLSQSLRQRDDCGEHPAALGRPDMEAFLHRLSYLHSTGQLSADARIRTCREVRAVLRRARAMGLTRPGGPAPGLGEDFALHRDDVPVPPEPGEPGRDLPPEILRQICAHLPEITNPQMRTGIELAIDTGRRPEEICTLPYDCLTYDDGAPVLVYTNHKANRLDRRLPISPATAAIITAQQHRVRAQYPTTMLAELKLLPTDRRNPTGTRAITPFSLAFHHRTWITTITDLRTADDTEFDRTKIVLYAYRHSYAQRHADAGTPIDVLRELMDHRKLDATKRYYHVGESRRREAVDRVAAWQFDRHGNRVWQQAKTLLETATTHHAGQVAVPYGVCAEPTNVRSGGSTCPCRFRCAGCDHFHTDASYLPDLQAYLDDLLRCREHLRAAAGLDDWARTDATPSGEEITQIRRLIAQITAGLDDLDAADRAHIDQAITTIRHHRANTRAMRAALKTTYDPRAERPA